MASFGAKYPHFCPVKTEPEGARPTYDGNPVRIGRLVKADLSITLASGQLYADDQLAESVDEFVSGSVAMETDDMTDEVAAVIYGATVEDGTVHYNVADDPPKGGYGYIKKLMRDKKVLYKAYFYPLVKAVLGNDSAATKSNSITFGTTATTLTIFACETGDWRDTHETSTEADALAWLKAQFTPSAPGGTLGTLTVTSAAGADSGDTSITITPAKAAGNLYKYKVGAVAQPVTYGQNVQTWQAWDGSTDIAAADGQIITVVECGSDYKAVAAGSATVSAKA